MNMIRAQKFLLFGDCVESWLTRLKKTKPIKQRVKLSLQATYPKQMIQQRMKIYKTCWLLEKGKELANWAHIKGDLSLFRHGLWLCTSCRDTFLDKNNDWSLEFIRIFYMWKLSGGHPLPGEKAHQYMYIYVYESYAKGQIWMCSRTNVFWQSLKCPLSRILQIIIMKLSDYPPNIPTSTMSGKFGMEFANVSRKYFFQRRWCFARTRVFIQPSLSSVSTVCKQKESDAVYCWRFVNPAVTT